MLAERLRGTLGLFSESTRNLYFCSAVREKLLAMGTAQAGDQGGRVGLVVVAEKRWRSRGMTSKPSKPRPDRPDRPSVSRDGPSEPPRVPPVPCVQPAPATDWRCTLLVASLPASSSPRPCTATLLAGLTRRQWSSPSAALPPSRHRSGYPKAAPSPSNNDPGAGCSPYPAGRRRFRARLPSIGSK